MCNLSREDASDAGIYESQFLCKYKYPIGGIESVWREEQPVT